ncbi:MAG: RNase adaptor protein RapZ, partial [Candidatus Eremiobacteraeota bacterium]|nr:RNase adaptor protein RapZ [Candidatus Eremiobacteraeota bacterium]
MTFARFVIVAGLSGAGKSQVMKSFEDLGFYCLDNLPPALVLELLGLARGAGIERVALSLDMRVRGPFGEALGVLDALRAREIA